MRKPAWLSGPILLVAMGVVPGAEAANPVYTYEYHGTGCQLAKGSLDAKYLSGYSQEGISVTTPQDPITHQMPTDSAVVLCPAIISTDVTQFDVSLSSFIASLTLSGTAIPFSAQCGLYLATSNDGHYIPAAPSTAYPVERAYVQCLIKNASPVALNGYTLQMVYTDVSE